MNSVCDFNLKHIQTMRLKSPSRRWKLSHWGIQKMQDPLIIKATLEDEPQNVWWHIRFKVILAQKLQQAMLLLLHQCLHYATSTLYDHTRTNKWTNEYFDGLHRIIYYLLERIQFQTRTWDNKYPKSAKFWEGISICKTTKTRICNS